MLVVTNTDAFGATLVVPLAGLTVTAAARWADKLAADLVAALVAVLEPLCTVPQAETVIAATITAAPMAPTRLTVRQYAVSSLATDGALPQIRDRSRGSVVPSHGVWIVPNLALAWRSPGSLRLCQSSHQCGPLVAAT